MDVASDQKLLGSRKLFLLRQLIPYVVSSDRVIKFRLIAALIMTFAVMTCNVIIPLILKRATDFLASPNSVNTNIITVLLIAYAVAWAASRIMYAVREIFLFRVLEHAVGALRLHLFQHAHNLSLRFHLNRKIGAFANAIERVHDAFGDISWGLIVMVPTIVEIFIAMIILWRAYGIFYGYVLLLVLGVSLIFDFIGARRIAATQRAHAEKGSQAGAFFLDSLINFETVKHFGNQNYEQAQYQTILQKSEEVTSKAYAQRELIGMGETTILSLGLLVLMLKSGLGVMHHTMQVGDFIAINTYVLQCVVPIQYFSYYLRRMHKGFDNLEGSLRILRLQPEIVDAPDAVPLQITKAEITFDHVSFGYNARRPILHDVSFTIPSGKMIAIVGSSGAGKSTISRLLFRFYDVTSGTIYIDGQDIRSVTQDSLHVAIGIVPQDTILFNNTLYYNIAYGRPSATKEEVEQAIALANLSSFIAMLPEGYNTPVGERGLKLSGGEKQRVAIARVILKRPAIYVFDEATSALDTVNEQQIQHNLEQVARGSTTLVIAHRLSTVVHADEIIVLEHGKVMQRGTHEELLKDPQGAYVRLWQKQSLCPS